MFSFFFFFFKFLRKCPAEHAWPDDHLHTGHLAFEILFAEYFVSELHLIPLELPVQESMWTTHLAQVSSLLGPYYLLTCHHHWQVE